MNQKNPFFLIMFIVLTFFSSCVSKKQFLSEQEKSQKQVDVAEKQRIECDEERNLLMKKITSLENERQKLESEIKSLNTTVKLREEQLTDVQQTRDKQLVQVGDLTVLSQTANENIKETLAQLETKDKYIKLLQAAKTKADSINLALAVNLKSVLKNGIEDEDIEIKVDKTVVFINISDKMLYESGKSTINPKAKKVLEKIALIIQSRPELEVMVEGYTDNRPIEKENIKDNWDLSVLRAASVVRTLQTEYKVDPNKLIAAGRGQYNAIGDNETQEGQAMNRRTRIILLPKLNQFYDLLNPGEVEK